MKRLVAWVATLVIAWAIVCGVIFFAAWCFDMVITLKQATGIAVLWLIIVAPLRGAK